MDRRKGRGLFCAALMLILIANAPGAAAACRDGIELCLKTLIPSLFPFFVISILLTDALSTWNMPLFRILERFCRLPTGAGCLLVTGFLGGYPVGAQNISMAYQRGQLPKQDAERMLAFCSNAGPAFIFGMVASFFGSAFFPWLLWLIHILSALLVSRLIPGEISVFRNDSSPKPVTLVMAMEKSITAMTAVCGWVVIFRIVVVFLTRSVIGSLPESGKVLMTGLLELSNGCILLEIIQSPGMRFLIASVMLAFGGLCVTMQTQAVCGDLSLRFYLKGKALQVIISIILSLGMQGFFRPGDRISLNSSTRILFFAAAAFFSLVCTAKKNKGSIPQKVVV